MVEKAAFDCFSDVYIFFTSYLSASLIWQIQPQKCFVPPPGIFCFLNKRVNHYTVEPLSV